MVDIREILCPTDLSDASRHALAHAVVIAKWYGSRITVLHVKHVPLLSEAAILSGAGDPFTPPTLSSDQQQQEDVQAWVEAAVRAGIATDVVLDEGAAARRILDRAESTKTDLIVMGTHGLSGFERFMLGSVTEKVLRKATCPVLTVPPAAETAATVPYTSLLCAVDFSPSSLDALRFAMSLAKEADARLRILHVFDWQPDDELLVARFDDLVFRQAVEERVRGRLEALLTDEERVWCKPTTSIAYGKPYVEIVDAAMKENADLIVMGVRGRNPVDLAIFGSTTNQVVRRATCPVLTLR